MEPVRQLGVLGDYLLIVCHRVRPTRRRYRTVISATYPQRREIALSIAELALSSPVDFFEQLIDEWTPTTASPVPGIPVKRPVVDIEPVIPDASIQLRRRSGGPSPPALSLPGHRWLPFRNDPLLTLKS
ncbi:MAG TPA: hypothetical protein VHV09_16210, partial [Trebonia sp.]|nr:hypothetical protein [Trebonia sp.]